MTLVDTKNALRNSGAVSQGLDGLLERNRARMCPALRELKIRRSPHGGPKWHVDEQRFLAHGDEKWDPVYEAIRLLAQDDLL